MNGAEQSRIERRDRAQHRRRQGMRVHDSARTLALLRRDALQRRGGSENGAPGTSPGR